MKRSAALTPLSHDHQHGLAVALELSRATEATAALIGLTYACIGALAGAALGQLGATHLILFIAMLGMGILQNPMFGDGTPGGLAFAFPDYGASRVVIDGAFSKPSHAWAELALAAGWLAALSAAVALALHRNLAGKF